MKSQESFYTEIPPDKDCQDCKNYILYKSLSFFNKLRRRGDQIKSMENTSRKFSERFGPAKNIEFCLKYWNVWAYKGKSAVKNYRETKFSGAYHSIIIVNYARKGFYKNLPTYAGGIDLLVEFFKSKSLPFKITICEDYECFENAINDPSAKNLWIFGHGDRHGISFGDGIYLPYCRLKDAPKKDFIAQLHCSNGKGKALWEFLSITGDSGIFSEDYRNVLQNREDVKEWIRRNKN